MKNFKIEVSRWLEKYNIIRKSEHEMILRDELHKEGFIVLSLIEISDLEISWNKFFFEFIEKNWETKIWTIVLDDIFKAYLKVKHELWYNLTYIYQNKDTIQAEKEIIIKDLEAHYLIYLETNKKDIKEKEKQEISKIKEIKEESIDSFQMKKELDHLYKILDKVLFKLKNIIEMESSGFINFEKIELLKKIYSDLVKIKSSTNIPKLKQIWEIALNKIWEIELQILEDKKSKEYEILLKETNKLLREVGSKKTFVEKDKDIWYILNKVFFDLKNFIKEIKTPKNEKKVIDKVSNSYLKNKYLLTKYQQKLKQIRIEKLKNFFIYIIPTKVNQEKVIDLSIKEKVVLQNITLLNWRIKWGIFSYVKVVKGYNFFIYKLLYFLNFMELPLFCIIVLYSIIFFLVKYLHFYLWINIDFNFNWLFLFIYLIFIYILLQLTKWILSLSFNIVIFIFLFIFWVINF